MQGVPADSFWQGTYNALPARKRATGRCALRRTANASRQSHRADHRRTRVNRLWAGSA